MREREIAINRILKARIGLCLRAPFLSSSLMRLVIREASEYVSTFATDGFRIFYNESFVEKLTDEEIRGVLAHELMHVLTDSLGRERGRIHALWNAACDYAINATLLTMGFKIPDGGLLSDEYMGLTSEAIYERLLSGQEGTLKRFVLKDSKCGAGERDCIGTIPTEIEADVLPEGSAIRGLLPSEEGEPTDEESIRIAVGAMRKEFVEACKSHGLFPASLQAELKIAQTSQIDWRSLLQHWLIDRVKCDWTLFPPAKKFISQGIYLPSLGSPAPCKIVFAVDTSASMSSRDLSQIYSEIRNFRDTFPSELIILQGDAKVQSVKEYGEFEDFEDPERIKVFGRGGTDFRPIFQWVEEHCAEDPIVIVHATDGYGKFPQDCKWPIVWLLTKVHSDAIPHWGEEIVIGT